ncbi:MAG: hypothetical protein WD990_07325 [Acidimicrobiia bacterium]
MDNAHKPPATLDHIDPAPLDDPFDRALAELARAGIGFEVVADSSPLERAA